MDYDDHDAIVRLTTEMGHVRSELRELSREMKSLRKEHQELSKKVVTNGVRLGFMISVTVIAIAMFDEAIKQVLFSFTS